MTPDLRRNACPTIAAPMETGDGLLARLPPSRPLSSAEIRSVAEAARRFGNGILEITARGSFQVRGLSSKTAPPFAAALAVIGIADAPPAIHLPPLLRDEAVAGLAAALRSAIADANLGPRLAPKTSVVVDGTGTLHLDGLDADLRLLVDGDSVALAIGGTARTSRSLGRVPGSRAIAAALAAIEALAREGVRGRDLDPHSIAAIIGVEPRPMAEPRAPMESVAVQDLGAGKVAIGVGLPFGQVEAATLDALVDAATVLGAGQFETAPGRVLVAVGFDADDAAAFHRQAAELGFIVDAADPRRAVAACPGAPACTSGRMPARAAASDVAAAAGAVLDGSVTLHISGCTKGCAHPRAATLALVGTDAGLAIAVNGRAADTIPAGPPATDPVAAMAEIARVAAAERRPGETAAGVIARIGRARLAAALRHETVDA